MEDLGGIRFDGLNNAVRRKSSRLLDASRPRQKQQEVKDSAQPQCIVDDNDNDMIDEPSEESQAEEDLFDSVCALCDDGGKLLCCDGVCMRSFHATEKDGRDSNCDSLGFTRKEVNVIQRFHCKNCKYNQHQCFACGKLGSSDKVKGAEVIKCSSATCGCFYHPRCVAKLLPMVVKFKHVGEELEKNIADGHPFICPIHYCCVCKELENKMEPELQMAICRRCPKSYHRKCLPRQISFDDEDNLPRAWEGLLSNNRILIYCLNHEIDDELETPKRDHLKLPNVKATFSEINAADVRTKPAYKAGVILKKNNVGRDKGLELTGRLSFGELGGKNKLKSNEMNKGYEQIKPVNQFDNGSLLLKPTIKLSCSLPPSDADSEKRVSKSDKTSRKRKHIKENDTRGQGVGSPAKRQAVNEMIEAVSDHSQLIPINRSGTFEHIVLQPGHRYVLKKGYASGPYIEYSRRYSAGWLDE